MRLLCLVVLVTGVVGTHSQCPNFTPSQTCTCRGMKDKSGEEFSVITCRDLHSEDALERILAACKELPIFELELIDCSFRYLPHDAFVGTTVEVSIFLN
ncbi:hypothetical protein AVEN_256407-1 [Araneus ventricosus]|uniref:Uncharacterized protein n=1 Tax=Araneus ventricosus TaxID=182803 RepID=A0A4Y2G101_ARAVE|nr:hypothetical protein AVEN_256407-1 [Araneus ventricosus]